MPDEPGLIASHYRIEASRPARVLPGGLRAFPVTDRREPSLKLIGVLTRPDLPARPRVTLARAGPAVPYAVLPHDYGVGCDLEGRLGWYAVGESPPGEAVGVPRLPWREQELIACVLLPVAAALLGLQARGLTHGAVNPDNLFREQAMEPVTLGPFWAAPAGSLQNPAYAPPYLARCLPSGRGNGTIADDVYALGVTLLVLASGRAPMSGLDDEAALRRKIERGSLAALTADLPLPPVIGDLLRSMLAEDPDHRPPPTLLLNPEQARARRIAARPPRRSHTPLNVGGTMVWTARELAHALGNKPDHAFPLLKSSAVERWLRRSLGDPQLGMAVEDVTRRPQVLQLSDDPVQRETMVMLAICAIDAQAPLMWRGVALQPDGLGAAFVGAAGPTLSALEEIVGAEAVPTWLDWRERRPELAQQREEARDLRRHLQSGGAAGGLRRLVYIANPMLPCASPLLPGPYVVRIADLLPALNAAAAASDQSKPPIDTHIAAFVAARADSAVLGDLCAQKGFAGPAARLAVLRLYGRLEKRMQPGPLPGLSNWLVASGFATLDDWRSHKQRAALEDGVKQAAAAGHIGGILALVDDEAGRKADADGADAAAARLKLLEAALADIQSSGARRANAAQLLGHELATGAGLLAVLGAALRLALP